MGAIAENKPAVAIVMRTKDRPILLERAVADVCAQSYMDWRLVVVNDGGDPAEVDRILAAHEGVTDRLTVLHHEHSRGMEAASNLAIKASDSRYISIHDDDDTWHPLFLERAVAFLDTTDAAAVAVRTEIVWEEIEGGRILEKERESLFPELHSFTLFKTIRINRTVPISLLYRRAVHDEVGLYREDLPVVGDWEFNLRLGMSGHELGFIDGEPLAFWHRRRSGEGPLANSVLDRLDEHREMDLMLREEALRDHVRRHGLGGLLYLTAYIQGEVDLLHGRHGQTQELLDRLIRDSEEWAQQRELLVQQRELLERQGELVRRQTDLLAERLSQLEAGVSDASLVSLARRRYRRLKDRVLGRG